jgi:8-oxo-dGTP pyrophosphatase MutT (NUDIX family)
MVSRAELDVLTARLTARRARRIDDPESRRAAVAVVLRVVDEETQVLLIRRAERPDDHWSGHMALPGGRAEPEDVDLIATAMREADEEVGLALERARLLGPLDELYPRNGRGLVVSPFVFRVEGAPALRLSDEVSEWLWAPLAPLRAGEAATEYPLEYNGMAMRFPAWKVTAPGGERVVWGMTYRALESLLEVLDLER